MTESRNNRYKTSLWHDVLNTSSFLLPSLLLSIDFGRTLCSFCPTLVRQPGDKRRRAHNRELRDDISRHFESFWWRKKVPFKQTEENFKIITLARSHEARAGRGKTLGTRLLCNSLI